MNLKSIAIASAVGSLLAMGTVTVSATLADSATVAAMLATGCGFAGS